MRAVLYAAVLALASAATLAGPAPAQSAFVLTTDAAGKLPTTAGTREAMASIRTSVINAHTLITHRRLPSAAAKKFAADVKQQTERILNADARDAATEQLAPLLRRIGDGADAVAAPKGQQDAIDGLLAIVTALNDYASRFEHPGWRGLQEN